MKDKRNNLGRSYILGAIILFCFLIHFLVHLANTITIQGFPLGFYLAAQLAPLLLAIITIWHIVSSCKSSTATEANCHSNQSAFSSGGGIASTLMSGAILIGIIGASAALGYDGLVFPLGLIGGLALAAFFLPVLEEKQATESHARHQNPFINFVASRFSSVPVTLLAIAVTCICLFLLVMAEITALEFLTSWLALPFEKLVRLGALVACIGVLAFFLPRSWIAFGQTCALILLLAGLTITSGFVASKLYGAPVPQMSYGHAISEITNLQQVMIENGRADPGAITPFVRPNTQFDPFNFYAIITCILLGVAALVQFCQQPPVKRASSWSGRSCLWGIIIALSVAITAPAVAAFTKVEIYRAISAGIPKKTLPAWIESRAESDVIGVCNVAADPEGEAPNACANSRPQLSLQDLKFPHHAAYFVAQEVAGVPQWTITTIVVMFCLAVIANAAALTQILLSVASTPQPQRPIKAETDSNDTTAPADTITSLTSRAVIIFVALSTASLAAVWLNQGIMTLFTWSLTLAAAGLFPILLIAQFWPRSNPKALVIGTALGVGLCAYYIVAPTYFAPTFLDQWSEYSNAPPWRLEYLQVLKEECQTAGARACALVDSNARSMANWWGIENEAAAILSLPVTFLVFGLLSLILPSRKTGEGLNQ